MFFIYLGLVAVWDFFREVVRKWPWCNFSMKIGHNITDIPYELDLKKVRTKLGFFFFLTCLSPFFLPIAWYPKFRLLNTQPGFSLPEARGCGSGPGSSLCQKPGARSGFSINTQIQNLFETELFLQYSWTFFFAKVDP